MSFRSFVYYCAAWGAAAAYFGWALGRVLEHDSPLLGVALKGMCLGLFVALGLGLLDGLAGGSPGDYVALAVRLALAVLLGTVGGLVGGFVGQGFYQLFDSKYSALLVLGWVLTGTLVGGAPSSFDFLAAVLRKEERRGARNKLRNGLLGGALGGLLGGTVSVLLRGAWGLVFSNPDAQSLWSPSATGFVALGACIGLSVAAAQVILREAWLRVDVGFRPGRQILLTKQETTIGRGEACDVGLFGDPAIEKLHAKILRQGDHWVVADAGTPGGTQINGKTIAAPTPLRSGDLIQVGKSVLSIGMKAGQGEPAAPVPAPA
jgi:hypothetical protein